MSYLCQMHRLVAIFYFLFLMVILPEDSFCQDRDSSSMLLISGRYGYGVPMGTLSETFGSHSALGSQITYLWKGWSIGAGYNFLFGNVVKDDPLSNLRTLEGGIVGSDMQFASVFLRERGHLFHGEFGRFFSNKGNHGTRGIFVHVGGGYISHKIRIVDDFGSIIQIREPYNRGYDRLRGGLCLTQQLGYRYLSQDRLVNFYVALQGVQGFTEDLRVVHYNGVEVDARSVDLFIQIQIGWIVPISLQKKQRFY